MSQGHSEAQSASAKKNARIWAFIGTQGKLRMGQVQASSGGTVKHPSQLSHALYIIHYLKSSHLSLVLNTSLPLKRLFHSRFLSNKVSFYVSTGRAKSHGQPTSQNPIEQANWKAHGRHENDVVRSRPVGGRRNKKTKHSKMMSLIPP